MVDGQGSTGRDNLFLTAEQLALVLGRPLSTIYRWAFRDHWASTRYARPARYRVSDAEAKFERYRGN